ncbi:MAG: hypothetical protein ACKKMV_01460 [Candidatus Nealsonbacteria bacterium]
MGNSLLITRPEYDPPTYYLSKWSKYIIDEARNKGVRVIDLWRDKANRKRVVGTLEKVAPRLVFFNGHGSEDFITGHGGKVVLRKGDGKAVKSKIIFARSCRCAKVLGQYAIEQGALAFLGYKEDFWLRCNITKISQPLEDKTAALFLKPSNHLMVALLKGHSTGYANAKSKELFRKNIKELLIAGPSAEDYDSITALYWNMIHQVCLGDKDAIF